MEIPWYVLVGAGVVGSLILWSRFILRKLNYYETKEVIDEIKKDAKDSVDSTSLDELIWDTNERRRNRHDS